MPIDQKIKDRAYQIDPECWKSYSGMPRGHKQHMELRREKSLREAGREAATMRDEDISVVVKTEDAMENKDICPEDELCVLLPVEKIPSGAVVSKRTGEQRFTLRRKLVVGYYPQPQEVRPPMSVNGFFMITACGYVTQIDPGTVLAWRVSAERFMELIQYSWEERNSQ